jgi:hypothetical protein
MKRVALLPILGFGEKGRESPFLRSMCRYYWRNVFNVSFFVEPFVESRPHQFLKYIPFLLFFTIILLLFLDYFSTLCPRGQVNLSKKIHLKSPETDEYELD